MPLDNVPSGRDVPEEINVIIEIPLRSDPVKYEVDKSAGALVVDRFLETAMHYPCNYGYVPRTLAEDGDPVDVMVVGDYPLISGCVIRCRPVGVLKMTDEAGADAKIVAVPATEVTEHYRDVNGIDDLPPSLLARLAHFFEHYKDLEPGKWVRSEGWGSAAEAKTEIRNAVRRYEETSA